MKSIFPMSLMPVLAALLVLAAPAYATVSDNKIILSARQSYVFEVYLAGDDIKIESKNGAVTLTGIIAEYFHKSLAEVTLTDIPGVKSVDNRLEVKGSSPTANSDAWFRDKVKATLLLHWSLNASKTEVDVKDGIVTLRGNAVSQTQKELTAEYAKDVDGVKDVVNEMTVSVAVETPARTTGEKVDDVSVAALVRMGLLLHHSTSGIYTKIAVKRGVVTVDGRARNISEKDQVTKLIRDINGVKKVKNLMTVD